MSDWVPRGEEVSEDNLADIAYLARSKNRNEILETLSTGPQTSREVEEGTGVARSTRKRIISELEDRGWAERTNEGGYILTETGEHFAAETNQYVCAIQATKAGGDAVTWLWNLTLFE